MKLTLVPPLIDADPWREGSVYRHANGDVAFAYHHDDTNETVLVTVRHMQSAGHAGAVAEDEGFADLDPLP